MRGWLGAHENVREIINIIQFDGEFPCHVDVNRICDEDELPFEDAIEFAQLCAGSLAFLNNQLKLSRNASVRRAQDKVGKREDVFQWPHEMEAHHDG